MKPQQWMLYLGVLAAAWCLGSGGVAEGGNRNPADRIPELVQRLHYAPVDARVDRVWHAIPGLCGWKIDIDGSHRETRAHGDGRVHLAWDKQCPAKRLANLPPEPIYRGPSAEKSMALMFNVSWGEANVPSILDTLRQEKVFATFFLDGSWVKKHPDLAKRIAAAGHVIGSHGTGHPDFSKLSTSRLESQIAGTNHVIEHTLGKRPRLLAPPAGAYDNRTVQLAHRYGMNTILWTVDTLDWRRPPSSAIVSRVIGGATPGGLVLMHPTAPTAAALPSVIRGLKERGYRLKTVEQVVREEPVIKPPSYLE